MQLLTIDVLPACHVQTKRQHQIGRHWLTLKLASQS